MAGRFDHVQFWTNSYWTFGWDWDAGMHAWRRNDAGVEHIDAGTIRVLSATSVLAQYVKEDVVYAGSDPGGYPRRYHHLVGQGRATLTSTARRSRSTGRGRPPGTTPVHLSA